MPQVCKEVADTAQPGLEVLVPCTKNGLFLMGSETNDPQDPNAQSNEIPETPEFVQAFYLDQTEVAVQAYQGCVEGGGCTAPGTGGSCNW